MNKLEIYKLLIKVGAVSSLGISEHFGAMENEVINIVANDQGAFAYDETAMTYSAVPGWAEASSQFTADSINSLAELLLKAETVNPDEMAMFLAENGVSTGLLADGEYLVKRMGSEGGELDQLATKFGLDTANVPEATAYIADLKGQFMAVGAILHALKLKA